ncbi:hypothetical protein ZOSMA_127G00310 [Zostera marina]|uniref:Uncharacterized protein n=1 Tax=Zostera marina TaxID=29655 RepID=A0A0K9Q230_ZOSMR|nr:hypothetical protein ZOSMA_127G00310 [Zostera marina]
MIGFFLFVLGCCLDRVFLWLPFESIWNYRCFYLIPALNMSLFKKKATKKRSGLGSSSTHEKEKLLLNIKGVDVLGSRSCIF